VDGDPEPLPRHAEVLREELPGEADRVALEVVAEGEVPEHLEEGVVPRGEAHLLEIVVFPTRANALLRGRRPPRRQLLGAEEDALELHHPRVREEQGGIVRGDERRRGNHLVAVASEVFQEPCPNLVGAHLYAQAEG